MRDLVVSSSVLILFVILLRIIFGKRISHRLRYALWLIVAVRLALPFTLPGSPASIMNFVPRMQQIWDREAASGQDKNMQNENGSEEGAQNESVPDESMQNEGVPDESGRSGAVPDIAAAGGLTGEGTGSAMMLMIREGAAEIRNSESTAETGMIPQKAVPDVTGIPKFLCLLPAVWLAGAVCVGSYLLIINLIVWRRLRRTRVPVKLDEPAWEGGKPAVYCCEKLVSPCLFGLFRPAIYLNGKALADRKGCFYALAHERQHYRHKDHIWSFVRLVLVTVYWFHPLVWLAAVLSARDCELACDEGVAARITEEECVQYGRALLSQVPSKRGGLHVTVSTSMSGGARQLRQRLLAITHRRKTSAGAALLTAAMLLLITGCTFTGAEGGSSDTEKNSADFPSVENSNGDDGLEGVGGQEPAQPVSADSELLLKLEESIRVDEDGELAFTIPASDHEPEDWIFSFRGKRNDGSDWGTGDPFHIVDLVKGESAAQQQAMDCIMNIVPSDFSELSMTVTLSSFAADGEETRTAVVINLLTDKREALKPEETQEKTAQTALGAYTMFSDRRHGWALTKDHQIFYTFEGEDRFSLIGSLPFTAQIRNADAVAGASDAGDPAGFLADNGVDISSCFLDEKTAYFAGVSANEGEAFLIRLQIMSEPEAGDEDGEVLVSEHRTRIPLQEYYWCGNVYVSFADAQNGYLLVCSDPALGQMAKHLYRTTDGGDSFSFVADLSTVIKGYPGGMAFCDENTGYIGVSIRGDSSNYLYGTPDGGLTWESVEVPVHTDAYYVDAPVPVVFHEDGAVQMAIVLRNVGGRTDRYVLYENPHPADFSTWQIIEILPYEEIKGYSLSDQDTGYFIDGDGVLRKWEYDGF